MQEFFARCGSGFEAVLAQELKDLGCTRVRPLLGGVAFFGEQEIMYRACLWSRCATRIQMVIARIGARDAPELYENCKAIEWENLLVPNASIAVRVHGVNAQLKNTQFSALKVKDALCDRMREVQGQRPNVDASSPDFAVDISLHESKATLYVNMSGPALHRRAYRKSGMQTQAPLKETLAASLLLAAGWDRLAAEGALFADPMCGSGTLAIEAALIATNTAPGILRNRWGFTGWAGHNPATWDNVYSGACAQAEEGRAALRKQDFVGAQAILVAGDIDKKAIGLARENAKRAGVEEFIQFYVDDASELSSHLPAVRNMHAGLLACNPPYGVRMHTQELDAVYEALAKAKDSLAQVGSADEEIHARSAINMPMPATWSMALITPDATIDAALGQDATNIIACYNGPIEAAVRLYSSCIPRRRLNLVSLRGIERSVVVREANSEQFAARVRKVAKEKAKWARKEGISCYRIYDADLPDYAVAIDVFAGTAVNNPTTEKATLFARVVEYQAPSSVNASRAQKRFADAQALVPAVLDIEDTHVFSKVRRREKGGGQYRDARSRHFIIHAHEGGFLFELDLNGYLDTGLFLDHRITRGFIKEHASGKRFLNLFAYTGTATVYAAGGGAAQTTTVDLSATYLAWAKRNMQLNNFVGPSHRFDQADVLSWLEKEGTTQNRYDLIFCDPPTFSNSKSMDSTFDVQRDHVELLRLASGVLAPEGTLVFSCNLRNFKPNAAALAEGGLELTDITATTIPFDYARNSKVHQCFLVQHDKMKRSF